MPPKDYKLSEEVKKRISFAMKGIGLGRKLSESTYTSGEVMARI